VAATADRFFPTGPNPREVWLTFGLSVLVHGLLAAAVVMIPRLQVGTYIRVPVSYTVDLVSAPPGGSGGGPPAAARPAAPPPPAQVAPAPPARPAPQPVLRPTEELTLPGRHPPAKPREEREPSLRPPSVTKETTRPAPPAPLVPAAPAVPQPAPPVASATPRAGSGQAGGAEVVGTASGAGSGAAGGSALASYLALVDWKIQANWVPVGASSSPETVVVVRFRVLRSGQVRDVELDTSSSNASVDNSALRAVRQSIPLPPFPNLLTESYLDLRYRFVMER
jgi:TonB family protein